jgi:integrase
MPPIISDVVLRNAKPKDKAYRIQIGGNCFLEVLTDGVKWWRMRYRRPQTGQQAILDLGFYRSELVDRKGSVDGLTNLSLNEAKAEAIEAKKLLKRGIDPQDYREEQKARIEAERQASLRAQAHSFETITREWHTHRRDSLQRWKSSKNAEKILHMLEVNLFPDLGALHISEVTAPLLLETIQKVVNRGAVETAKKLNRWTVDIFRYAVLRKLVAHNEADNLRGEIPAPLRKNNPYLKSEEIGNFIRQVEADTGGEIIKLAILLTLHCLTRTQETRFAQWSEFDLEAKVWNLPAERMKMGRAHTIPLTPQVLTLLERLRPFTGDKHYLFWNAGIGKPFSENAMLQVLYRLGLKGKLTIHGLRATGSTVLNEAGFRSDIIETALAHKEENAIRAAYNHAQYVEERRKMMNWWSDYLNGVEQGAQVIPIKTTKKV